MEQLPLGPDSLHLVQHLHEGQRYDHDRQPRLLPDIDGVKSLSHHEAQLDIKSIQQQLAAFEAKAGIKLPGGRPIVGDKDHRRLFLVDENDSEEDMAPLAAVLKNRRSRTSGVIAPEEIVETLPAARRAVRITQRELRAMRIEREDLERAYVRHRCTLLWQVGEMKRMQKQHDRVTRELSREVVNTARELESSRRRTSALQDIMNELEARGSKILRLTREKSRLEAMLEAQGIELPEIDEVCVGDRVKCDPFGTGKVLELRLDTRQLVVKLDFGGVGYIQEDNVVVLPSDTTYAETEEDLKQRFFEKIGALAQPSGKLRMLHGTFDFTREDSDDDENSENESDESSSSEDESGATPGDESMEDSSQRKGKRRRLIMTPSPGTTSKKRKNRRVIEFPASTVPIAPYDTGLLISPLSQLPERVAAVSPNALQWLPSYLPKNMDEWEQERYSSLQMKGEIERLRFQLQKSEGGDELSETNSRSSRADSVRSGEMRRTLRRKHSGQENAEDEGNESSDAAPPPAVQTKAKAKPAKRSLRPRRKAATASPKRNTLSMVLDNTAVVSSSSFWMAEILSALDGSWYSASAVVSGANSCGAPDCVFQLPLQSSNVDKHFGVTWHGQKSAALVPVGLVELVHELVEQREGHARREEEATQEQEEQENPVDAAKRQLQELETKLQGLTDQKHAKFQLLKDILVEEARSKMAGGAAASATVAKKRRVEFRDPSMTPSPAKMQSPAPAVEAANAASSATANPPASEKA
ncbi:unnamed protein product [Phytophthora lilii]|uniref:Unnamed protein product n=1 Tax=Phytophthora lilii TaxID=2077276 RepID=A0A9W6WLF2_9STRA|nr:unnamed protein product [Phytophthora lilii]